MPVGDLSLPHFAPPYLFHPTPASFHSQGGAPSAPFFIPPEAFIYTYLPLAAVWQLLPNPISLDTWWSMPECSVPLFSRGCKLLTGVHVREVWMLMRMRAAVHIVVLLWAGWPRGTLA